MNAYDYSPNDRFEYPLASPANTMDDFLNNIDANEYDNVMRDIEQWSSANKDQATPPLEVPNFDEGLDLNIAWNQGQTFSPSYTYPFTDNYFDNVEPSTEWNLAMGPSDVWTGSTESIAGTQPQLAVPDSLSAYGLLPSIGSVLDIPADRSCYQFPFHSSSESTCSCSSASPASSFSSTSFTLNSDPSVHMPVTTVLSNPAEGITWMEPETPGMWTEAYSQKRKRIDDEDVLPESAKSIEYISMATEPQTGRVTKRRAKVGDTKSSKPEIQSRREEETLWSINVTTENHASEDRVLARDRMPDAVSSQTAGPHIPPKIKGPEMMDDKARLHATIVATALSQLKDVHGRWPCTMPGCKAKDLGSEREAERHILTVKDHQLPGRLPPHVCDFCRERFTRSDALKRHVHQRRCPVLKKESGPVFIHYVRG